MTWLIDRYENLLELGQQRRQKLEESCKAFQLVREAGELAQWITDKVRRVTSRNVTATLHVTTRTSITCLMEGGGLRTLFLCMRSRT